MSFLFTRRWIKYIALALVAAVVCVLLAQWQDTRRATRDAEIERIEAHYGAEPVPLSDVLPQTDSPFPESSEWTHVEATGTYRTEDTTVARNRPKAGSAGYWVLVPFDVDGGGTLVVARGWAPGSGADATAAEAPPPPAGTVRISAWLRPAQDGDASENTATSVRAIDPSLMEGDGAYAHAYGYLNAEQPPPAEQLEALPEPNTDPGSHLSYTFQWYAFAVMILGGFVYAAKRERDAIQRGERDAQRAEESIVDGVEYVVVDKEALRAGGTRRSAGRRSGRNAGRTPGAVPGMRQEPRVMSRASRRQADDEDAALDSQLGV